MIYLQLIKYFLPKTAEDDWFLFLLGLTAGPDRIGDQPGRHGRRLALLLGDAGRLGPGAVLPPARGPPVSDAAHRRGCLPPQASEQDPYRGLFDIPYLAASLRVLSLTLVLGGLFFLLLPRQPGATRSRSSGTMTKHLTGFDEEVKLGQLGEILENDSVVMSVEFADENRQGPSHPPASRSGGA